MVVLLLILAVGCLTILRPFLSALLWALILSFATWPLHAWLVGRLRGRRTLAATLMTLLVAAMFILPLAAVGRGPLLPRSSPPEANSWPPSALGHTLLRPFENQVISEA